MNPAARTGLGRSVFSFFVVQAVITALFGLLNAGLDHGAAARSVALVAAVLCLGVGFLLNSRPSAITWMVAVGFEIAFIVVGVAAFAAWHIYMVGTIVAIGNVARLFRLRAAFDCWAVAAAHYRVRLRPAYRPSSRTLAGSRTRASSRKKKIT